MIVIFVINSKFKYAVQFWKLVPSTYQTVERLYAFHQVMFLI